MLKEKPRLVELRLAIILNHISKGFSKEKVNNILYFLKTYAVTINPEYDGLFNAILANSINDYLLLADKRELALASQVWYDNATKIKKMLNLSSYTYDTLYPDMKKNVTSDFLDSLEARYAIFENYYNMCNSVSDLYDTFKMYYTYRTHPLNDNYRYTELKFKYIYDNLYKLFDDKDKTNEFILKYCFNLKIDPAPVGRLIDNLDKIYRGYDNPLDSLLVSKELVTFGFIEGWSIGKTSEVLLNSNYNFLTARMLINKDETENEYFITKWFTPVILFDLLSNREVQKFIIAVGDFNAR